MVILDYKEWNMNIEIIKPDGDLMREVWYFSLSIGYSQSCIYFNSYSFQTRGSTRHRNWQKQTHWERLDKRRNNIDSPPLPSEVERGVIEKYQAYILTLAIVK